jgi:hypothetical protein
MEWFKEIKFNSYIYSSSKIIMLIAFILIAGLMIVALNYSKFSGKTYYYSECPENLKTGKCVNVYFESNLCTDGTILKQNLPYGDKLCYTEFMFPGEKIGERTPWIVRNFAWCGVGILFLAILLNTLIYNKDFFRWLKDMIGGSSFE